MPIKEFFKEFRKNKGVLTLLVLLSIIFIMGIYAPLFASSKPILIFSEGQIYSPLLSSLFDVTFFTKKVDLFFNVLMIVLPIYLIFLGLLHKKKSWITLFFVFVQMIGFKVCMLNSFANFQLLESKVHENKAYTFRPLIAQTHWQENAIDNHNRAFFQTVRVNGKSLWSSLFFGIRYSMAVAFGSTILAFSIGVFIGLMAGYFGKKIDFILGRLIEVWESMPTLFVLLLMAALSKSHEISFVILILALFSWTSIARIVRLEVLKQKSLPYVDVLKGFGFNPFLIIFKHILPSVSTTLLTLIPFAIVGAITYEAALSFLGIGDRQNCSIGLLIDEARRVYPMEPSLFWPPALLLMAILVSLVLLGDLSKKIIEHKEKVV